MTNRKLVLGSVVAAIIAGASLPSLARTHIDFHVNVAPPPPRYEAVPAPRVGYVWAPGYWDWRHNRHYWVAGHYTRHRPGHYYAPVRWVHRDGRYYYSRAAWRNDRDGDGVPNRYDPAPGNPYYR